MSSVDLSRALTNLPLKATESIVKDIFIPSLLEALGCKELERYSEYPTGRGADKVDFAARKNTNTDVFLHSRRDPYLLVEVKGQANNHGTHINLKEDTPQYLETRDQLKRYFLSKNCSTAQWGIITNSIHIQLFRRHGKIVVPATPSSSITPNNINEVVGHIKYLIDNPSRALTVCIYNNKGGIGKTTTTFNLAGILAKHSKRVLVVDFDLYQRDLTRIL